MKVLVFLALALAGIGGWHVASAPAAPSAAYLKAAQSTAQLDYVECLQQRPDLSESACSARAWDAAYRDYPRARTAPAAVETVATTQTQATNGMTIARETACISNPASEECQ